MTVDPRPIDALNAMGNALRARDQDQEAIACFRRALETAPNFPEAISNFGVAFNDLGDLEQTMIEQLDLVITVDTAAAHLAGGMGKSTWTLLAFASEWGWWMERDDSPWYPSMRLYRQKSAGDWGGVVEAVGSTLCQLAKA